VSGIEYFSWIVLCLLGLALLCYGVVHLVRWLRRPKDRPVREITNVRKGRYDI
jgi:hypothetical protein